MRKGLETRAWGRPDIFIILLKADLKYACFYFLPWEPLLNTGNTKAIEVFFHLVQGYICLGLIKLYSIALNIFIIIEKALCNFQFLKYIMLTKCVFLFFLEIANLLDL